MNEVRTINVCEQVLDLLILNRNPRGELIEQNVPKWLRDELGYSDTKAILDVIALLVFDGVVSVEYRYDNGHVAECYLINEAAAAAVDYEGLVRFADDTRVDDVRRAIASGLHVHRHFVAASSHLLSVKNAVVSRKRNVERKIHASNYTAEAVAQAAERLVSAMNDVVTAKAALYDASRARDEITAVLS